MTMATLATAVTAIRRHMYEATSHQVSMNSIGWLLANNY